jgi:UDPglucose 6-dehydrogenase
VPKDDNQITVVGAGYVGLTTATLLAQSGFKVFLLEINKERLDIIKTGHSFFFEEGLDILIKDSLKSGNLIPTDSYKESIPKCSVVLSCVGTPDNPDGSSNLSYVYAAAKEALIHMRDNAVYVQKSTVPVGTGEIVESIFKEAKKVINYVSNPEFLREGTAIYDTLWFDRIVAGGKHRISIDTVLALYKQLDLNRISIAKKAGIKGPKSHSGQYIATNRNSAELIKVTANAFLALKISFANSIAKLADQTDADINDVMDAVGADKRIGRAFLNAGRGYGGGCFPKDVSGLISSAKEHGVDLGIMTAASELNESMPGYIANKVKNALGSLEGKKVAVLGLAFKAGTSDARKSAGVKIANILDHDGAIISVFDPKANEEARDDLRKNINVHGTLEKAVESVEAVLVATDWPEFLQIELSSLKNMMSGSLFIDAVNSFDAKKVEVAKLKYIGVGR